MSSITSYMPANVTHDTDPRGSVMEAGAGDEEEGLPGKPKKFRLKLSKRLQNAALIAFVSQLLLLISFASPYWLSSYYFTDSAFKRLGLWDFCFHDYRHPSYQHDVKFTGCHWIYSPVLTNIRDWLQPGWFVFVQVTMCIALCVDTAGLMATSIMFMHYLIQYQLLILTVSFLCFLLTTLLVGFALITFYLRAFDRTWIMYPEFNRVDWAFYAGVFSFLGNAYASYLFYKEAKELKERTHKLKRLVVATNGQPSGEIDSIDAVYATRSSGNPYNQSMGGGSQQGRNSRSANSMYPVSTQV